MTADLATYYGCAAAAKKLTEHGLDVSERWMHQQVQAKRIPHVRLAGKVKFSDAHLAQIVEMHTYTPADPNELRPAPNRRRAS